MKWGILISSNAGLEISDGEKDLVIQIQPPEF